MTIANIHKLLEIVVKASATPWKIRSSYSGRGMFGKTCWAVDGDGDPMKIIEAAAALGLTGARMDDMGRGTIIYWPNYGVEP